MRHPPSLWLTHNRARFAPLRDTVRCDVAVIGGGIAGLSAAWHLGAKGASVALLERATFGGGSTGRSAGLLAQSSAYDLAELQELYGAERGTEIYRSVLEGLRSLGQTIESHGIDCSFRRAGAYYVAAEPSHRRSIEAEHRALTAAGIDTQLLTADAFPVSGITAALRTTGDASVDPSALARGLAGTMPPSVRVHEQTPVVAVRKHGPQHHVVTAVGGRVIADRIVLATGGSGFTSRMSALAVPFVSHIAVTRPLVDDATAALGDAILWDSYDIYHYIRRTPDHRLLIGGNDSVMGSLGYGRTDRVAQTLMQTLARYFPHVAPQADMAWSGEITLPPDGLPLIETRGNRTLLITDGLLLGWLLGRIAADRIRTGRSDYDHLYDAGRDMGFAGNLLRRLPFPRAAKIQLMRLGLAWTIWHSFLDERIVH